MLELDRVTEPSPDERDEFSLKEPPRPDFSLVANDSLRLANKSDIARFFEVSLPTVEHWINQGCPVIQRGRQGKGWVFDLLHVAKWKFEPKADALASLDPSKMSPRDRVDYYRGCNLQLKYEAERKKFVDADKVARQWGTIAMRLRMGLITSSADIAESIINETDIDIDLNRVELICKDAIMEILDKFCESELTPVGEARK